MADKLLYRDTNGIMTESSLAKDLVALKGDKGDKGDEGDKGDKGDTGDPGTTLHAGLTDTATSGHNANIINVTGISTNYVAATPDVEAHLAGIDTALGGKQAAGTYSTDIHSNITALNAVSGTNTGDETVTTIKNTLGAADTDSDGYLSSTDWNIFNGKLTNPMSASGDIIYGGTSGAATTLAKSTDGKYLKLVSGLPSWQDVSGLTNFTEAVNTSAPNGTVPVVSLTATNAATNVDFAIVAKGTGSILAQIPDNTATGGNKRGLKAVDLQMSRTANTMVSSGSYSFAVGQNNTASGICSFVACKDNVVSGNYSAAFGEGNTNSWTHNLVSGYYNTCNGSYSLVSGYSNTVGSNSAIVIGESNTLSASSNYSIIFGKTLNATKPYSRLYGYNWLTLNTGEHSVGWNGNASGAAALYWGTRELMLGIVTTNATQTNMSPTTTAETINQNNGQQIYINDISIYAVKQYPAVEYAVFNRRVVNSSGGLLSTTTIGTDLISSGLTGISITVTGGSTILIKVTGLASTTIKWHAIMNTKVLGNY